jgi:putative CocE/NonD family hydrolase
MLKLGAGAPLGVWLSSWGPGTARAGDAPVLKLRDTVPDPQDLFFEVRYPGKAPVRLAGHYWFSAAAAREKRRCPAIVELGPYRRRDGTLLADSLMYPWYAHNGYLCFRVDIQGSGDSEGVLDDEYTDEELQYCIQVIAQIASHPLCDGKVGMMGKSWSAINALMVAARPDRPAALKAVVVCCGTDDRFNDDVHYMGGAMMLDNFSWASSMWSWLPAPPDPLVVGERWKRLWRQRIRAADFWFKPWATHQSRDAYWSRTSVRDHVSDIGVPVFALSGWQDGYHNPVERLVRALGAAGKPVAGLIGPWGHKYPFDAYPGPRLDWLNYSLAHWWDVWLKDRPADPASQWPALPVWLGRSAEPDASSCADESGRWVAEDGQWGGRAQQRRWHLAPGRQLQDTAPPAAQLETPEVTVLDTAMLETSSWGECGNDDLPRDQSSADAAALFFDTDPLDADLDVFGYPQVWLELAASQASGCLAVRLCEVSPVSGASRLVSYTFFNLCDRAGDMARPVRLAPGARFTTRIALGLTGHTFRKGWKIRLAVAPSLFPTLWAGTGPLAITLFLGQGATNTLDLPVRPPRPDADAQVQALLPAAAPVPVVDAADYVPLLATARPERSTRTAHPSIRAGRATTVVDKLFDSGRYQYGGPLDRLWVDIVAQERYELSADDPLSLVATSSSTSVFERPHAGWRVRVETTSRLWNEKQPDGTAVFRYTATIRAFVADPAGADQPFEARSVEGTIPRRWI